MRYSPLTPTLLKEAREFLTEEEQRIYANSTVDSPKSKELKKKIETGKRNKTRKKVIYATTIIILMILAVLTPIIIYFLQ